jgi:hypothetical protein
VSTDVSEEHIASIFRVEKISSARNQRESRWQAAGNPGLYKKQKVSGRVVSFDIQRKTEYLAISASQVNDLEAEGQQIKVCSNFNNLGPIFNKRGISHEDICNKIRKVQAATGMLN